MTYPLFQGYGITLASLGRFQLNALIERDTGGFGFFDNISEERVFLPFAWMEEGVEGPSEVRSEADIGFNTAKCLQQTAQWSFFRYPLYCSYCETAVILIAPPVSVDSDWPTDFGQLWSDRGGEREGEGLEKVTLSAAPVNSFWREFGGQTCFLPNYFHTCFWEAKSGECTIQDQSTLHSLGDPVRLRSQGSGVG